MDILKIILYGIIEGITEWLPISSTGHLIIIEKFLSFNLSKDFINMFRVVIQLGAILAVIVVYFKKIWPFSLNEKKFIKYDTLMIWAKIIVACIPASIIGVLFDELFENLFYNEISVAIALIIVGLVFIIIENKENVIKIHNVSEISFGTAFVIGLYQLLAAIFPGVSRSGATIMGGLILGTSREISAEFSFLMAIPVMFGASLMKILDFGFSFTKGELIALIIGMLVAFMVSLLIIKFLLNYIKRHDFKIFGYYRIILGIIVILLELIGI